MAEYRKYLFDNFVVEDEVQKASPDNEDIALAHDQPVDETESAESYSADVEQNESVTDIEAETEIENETSTEIFVEQSPESVFTQEDIDNAVAKAKEEGYSQGILSAQQNEEARQNILLEEIKNQLSLILAAQEKQNEEQELSNLRFLAASLHKLLPTLEKIDGIPEIKQFLDDNFAYLSSQKSLAFFFNSEAIKQAAPLLEKAAAHNDFEGKIAVHKDDNLGFSDCRIEWADGYVERNTDKLLEKLENLLTNNQQERENG